MGQRKGSSSWLGLDPSPEEPSPKDRRGARGALLMSSALALSLLLNAALLALRFQAPAPASALAGSPRASAPSAAGAGQLPLLEWNDHERQRMLQRAESVFQVTGDWGRAADAR